MERQRTKRMAEEEEEEEAECGFCLFMKGGGCKDAFVAWEACVEEAEKNKEDVVEKCYQITGRLKECMEAHFSYYEPVSAPRRPWRRRPPENWPTRRPPLRLRPLIRSAATEVLPRLRMLGNKLSEEQIPGFSYDFPENEKTLSGHHPITTIHADTTSRQSHSYLAYPQH
ncbi:hypothetical protein QJS10_CPA09g01549 [Acorus calamus]|uniref:GCK domain-containing protein n=1 Tax=Acorus calamus TaxID=4465 RepID=A0AAV9E670_ACOCL|nr:hypothetical protein QJS10_CPA09g01549 [Acorus calamus]